MGGRWPGRLGQYVEPSEKDMWVFLFRLPPCPGFCSLLHTGDSHRLQRGHGWDTKASITKGEGGKEGREGGFGVRFPDLMGGREWLQRAPSS